MKSWTSVAVSLSLALSFTWAHAYQAEQGLIQHEVNEEDQGLNQEANQKPLQAVQENQPANQAKKILLVSDIDDTIKVSHILSRFGKYARALDITTPFRGMAPLFQLIQNENPFSTQIVYLSNAPKELVGVPAASVSHQLFLVNNRFPEGELILREDITDPNHKIRTLRRLIEAEMPDVLILIGDNAEKDVDVYHEVTREYAYLTQMQVVTFIHQVYSAKNNFFIPDAFEEIGRLPYAEQVGFVTPVEISLKLNELGLLKSESVAWMIKNVSPLIATEDRVKWDGLAPITFPSFKNCSNFKWNFTRPMGLEWMIKRVEKECN